MAVWKWLLSQRHGRCKPCRGQPL